MSDPTLSVVVVIVSDTMGTSADSLHVSGCLEALARQVDPPTMEIILPYHPRTEGIPVLRERFPSISYIEIEDLRTYTGRAGNREHHDELRARGLSLARGAIVALVEDHGRPDPHWCRRMVQVHTHENFSGVGGAIENGVDRPLNWAVYYCDFGKYQNPVARGESSYASDANTSYKRSALTAIRGLWEKSFHETAVNKVLLDRGEKLALDPDIVVYQERQDLRLGPALKERYVWGRSFAAARTQLIGSPARLTYAVLSPVLPLVLFSRIGATAWKKRRLFNRFVRSSVLVLFLLIAWSLGECVGYLTGRSAA